MQVLRNPGSCAKYLGALGTSRGSRVWVQLRSCVGGGFGRLCVTVWGSVGGPGPHQVHVRDAADLCQQS